MTLKINIDIEHPLSDSHQVWLCASDIQRPHNKHTYNRRQHQQMNSQTTLIYSPTPSFSSSVGVHMIARLQRAKSPRKYNHPMRRFMEILRRYRQRGGETGGRKVYFNCSGCWDRKIFTLQVSTLKRTKLFKTMRKCCEVSYDVRVGVTHGAMSISAGSYCAVCGDNPPVKPSQNTTRNPVKMRYRRLLFPQEGMLQSTGRSEQ